MAVGRYSMVRVKFPIRTALVWKLQSKSSHCVASGGMYGDDDDGMYFTFM